MKYIKAFEYEGIINEIGFLFDGDNCFVEFRLKGYPWQDMTKDNFFCKEFITIDKLKSDVEKYNL